MIGFTATPTGSTPGRLHEGKDAIFTDIAFEVVSVRTLIDNGWSGPLRFRCMGTELDVSRVGMWREFIAKDPEAAVDQEAITLGAVEEIPRLWGGAQELLVSCAGVDHAFMCGMNQGTRHQLRHHRRLYTEREAIIAAFKAPARSAA